MKDFQVFSIAGSSPSLGCPHGSCEQRSCLCMQGPVTLHGRGLEEVLWALEVKPAVVANQASIDAIVHQTALLLPCQEVIARELGEAPAGRREG